MSKKSFEKCKKELLSNFELSNDFGIDEAIELVDNYSLSTEELDAIFEIIRGADEDSSAVTTSDESEIKTLFEKYGVITRRRRRFYKEDLSVRNYSLANNTPYSLVFNDFHSEKHSWGEMLVDVVNYLCYKNHKTIDELLCFRVDWTKQLVFSTEKKTNYKQLFNGLFLNCNHTALHMCWLLQDVLCFFGVNPSEIQFYIHRSSLNEPKEISCLLERDFKEEFKKYLIDKKKKTEEIAERIINNIDCVMNPRLSNLSSTHSNFFLFDDYLMYINYSVKFEESINKDRRVTDKNKQIMKRYLEYLKEFYKQNGY